MMFDDYLKACHDFAQETTNWIGLDEYNFYTTTGNGWAESSDNASGGIDVSWAFHEDVNRENAWQHYIEELEKQVELADADEWDDEQCQAIRDLFSDLDL